MIETLIDLIDKNQKNQITVAELGVFDGATTKHYAPIVKRNSGLIYALDWFKGNEGANGAHGFNPNSKDAVLNAFKTNLKEYLDVVIILDGKTDDMIKEIPDNSLDICFIDADHRYKSVLNDIRNILPKMKSSGIVCGHDYDGDIDLNYKSFSAEDLQHDWVRGRHLGVIKAVHEVFGNDNVEKLCKTVWRAKDFSKTVI